MEPCLLFSETIHIHILWKVYNRIAEYSKFEPSNSLAWRIDLPIFLFRAFGHILEWSELISKWSDVVAYFWWAHSCFTKPWCSSCLPFFAGIPKFDVIYSRSLKFLKCSLSTNSTLHAAETLDRLIEMILMSWSTTRFKPIPDKFSLFQMRFLKDSRLGQTANFMWLCLWYFIASKFICL